MKLVTIRIKPKYGILTGEPVMMLNHVRFAVIEKIRVNTGDKIYWCIAHVGSALGRVSEWDVII
jgi:hypothetical protein